MPNPPQIKQILVPTDLSLFGTAALRYAELFHDRFAASAMVIFANEPLYPMTSFGESLGVDWNGPAVRDELAKELQDYVRGAVRNPDAYDLRVIDDVAPAAITDTAEEIHADLIIMGTHGRTGWRRAVLGSVAERVLRETDVPLLTVNAAAASAQRVAIESILCPVNFTTVAHDALRYASFVANKFDARLVVLNVEDEELPAVDVERDFSGWIDAAVRDHCDYRHLVVKGGAAEAVMDTANQFRTDLIVIGAQHRRFSDTTVIGSTTERITRTAWQPVLTVIRQPVEREAEVAA
jgi:nucleotide-binding universal stress UspA family protein